MNAEKGLMKVYVYTAVSAVLLSLLSIPKSGSAASLAQGNASGCTVTPSASILGACDNSTDAPTFDPNSNEIPGTGTIARLYPNLVSVDQPNGLPYTSVPDGNPVVYVSSADRQAVVVFKPSNINGSNPPNYPLEFAAGPNTGNPWIHGNSAGSYTGPTFDIFDPNTVITFPSPVRAFDFTLETNFPSATTVSATANDGTNVTLSQTANGNTTTYYGFYVSPQDPTTAITSIAFSPTASPGSPPTSQSKVQAILKYNSQHGVPLPLPSDVLANANSSQAVFIAQLRVTEFVPEPSNQLGTLAFSFFSAGYLLKRQLKKEQNG